MRRGSDETTPGAFSSPGRAFGAPYRSTAAQEPEPSVVEDNAMVTACVVDEKDLVAEYREKILKESERAEIVIVETEKNTEHNQPPTLWQRYAIPIFLFIFIMIFILVMALTFADGNDDDTIQSLPTVTMSPSDQHQDLSGGDPVLPPTLQAIQDRGYIRCRAVTSEQDEGFGFGIDLVRITYRCMQLMPLVTF
jgi:hypothetical protein